MKHIQVLFPGKISSIVLLMSFFLFTSCFEIIEDVQVKKDGSGQVSLTVNLSQSKTKLHSIMLLDSINGYKIPNEKDIKNYFDTISTTLKQTRGISNVQSQLDFDAFVFSVSCNFTDTQALNQVLMQLSTKEEATKIQHHKAFSYNKHQKTFIRSYHYDIAKEFSQVNTKDRNIFENASYRSIYHFDQSIKSSSNAAAKISKNKKAIMLLVDAQDLIGGKKTIKNKITLN